MGQTQYTRLHTEHTGVKKNVYFVRHGQSDDNVAPVFQSPVSPLSDLGQVQAARIAERAAKLDFDALITSTFERAKATAAAIALSTGKHSECSDLFVERMKPKSIDGKPFTDLHAQSTWREWEKSLYTPGMRVEDGENYDDQIARADQSLAYLLSRPEKAIFVVTHGYFLRTLVARVLFGEHLTPDAFRHLHRSAQMQNTGITVIRYQDAFEEDPSWRLWIYNDHAHLG